jgi:hypothetical protein
MPGFQKKQVVVIGGGAAGVFTAYHLKKNADFLFEVKVLEKEEKLGGHAHSQIVEENGQTVSIDGGAQFFTKSVQPEYWDLLEKEGFFAIPGDPLIQKPADITIWNQASGQLLFRVPNTTQALLDSINLGNVVDWLNFVILSGAAIQHYATGDWSLPFGTWLNSLPFQLTDKDKDSFKANIARPLLYQFGLIDPPLLDTLSAKFVVYYYVGGMPWDGNMVTPFSVWNSLIGLDGILERLKLNHGLDVRENHEVTSIVPKANDTYEVHASTPEGPKSFHADEIVFATNPKWTHGLLPGDAKFTDVKSVLYDMKYVTVPVDVQVTDTPDHMPGNDKANWSVSNVLKVDGITGDPTHYMLSIWFGKLRDEPLGARCFKSWGSPGLEPPTTDKHSSRDHHLMIGTPTFIDRRQTLRNEHQGKHNLWYTGGYILDYDCQNACLKSAARVGTRLFYKCLFDYIKSSAQFWLQSTEIDPPDVSEHLRSPEFPTEPQEWPPLLRTIANHLRRNFSDHDAVERWMKENPEGRPSS